MKAAVRGMLALRARLQGIWDGVIVPIPPNPEFDRWRARRPRTIEHDPPRLSRVDRLMEATATIWVALFWGALALGLVQCVEQAAAQSAGPAVQNPFDQGRAPPPKPRDPAPAPRRAPAGPSDAEVIKKIIAESIAEYEGPCACPYQSDRAGRSCGKRSAYNRPRGAAPLCFDKDVTPEMIANYRGR